VAHQTSKDRRTVVRPQTNHQNLRLLSLRKSPTMGIPSMLRAPARLSCLLKGKLFCLRSHSKTRN